VLHSFVLCALATTLVGAAANVAGALFGRRPGGVLGALVGHKLQVHSLVATVAVALLGPSVGYHREARTAIILQLLALAAHSLSSPKHDRAAFRWLALVLYLLALGSWLTPSDLDKGRTSGRLEAALGEAMLVSSRWAELQRHGGALFAWCRAQNNGGLEDKAAYDCALAGLAHGEALKRLAPIVENAWVSSNLLAATAAQDASLAYLQIHYRLGELPWLALKAPVGAGLFAALLVLQK
jgi:hypothetical protein